jgi:hypothetical protein
MLYYIMASHSKKQRPDKKPPKTRDARSTQVDRDRKRAQRAALGTPYSPDFTLWFKHRVAETRWAAEYVWDRQLAAALKEGSESDRSLRRYYTGESKKPQAPLAYAIGWAFHELGLKWCSGPVTLLAAGHASRFFKLLAVLASYGGLEREAALIFAFGSFKANSPMGGVDVAVANAKIGRYGLMRAAISVRKDARDALCLAARQRASIDRAWQDSINTERLQKAPAIFRYAYETVEQNASLSQTIRIAGALIMMAAFIETQDDRREQEVLRKLEALSPTRALHALLSLEAPG